MRKGLWAGVIVLVAGITIYYALGGFDPIEPTLGVIDEKVLAGKEFEGFYNSDEIAEIFVEVKEAISDSILAGPLTILSFDPDTSSNKIIHYYVGAPIKTRVPEGFKERRIESQRAAVIEINRHNLVMPRPEKINNVLTKFAEQQGFEPSNYTIEEYYSERELMIFLPVSD